ncbi:hypothetical protein AOQ84DRAFT_230424, partial [Glonium stellatum]
MEMAYRTTAPYLPYHTNPAPTNPANPALPYYTLLYPTLSSPLLCPSHPPQSFSPLTMTICYGQVSVLGDHVRLILCNARAIRYRDRRGTLAATQQVSGRAQTARKRAIAAAAVRSSNQPSGAPPSAALPEPVVGGAGWRWRALAGAGWCWLVLAGAGWCRVRDLLPAHPRWLRYCLPRLPRIGSWDAELAGRGNGGTSDHWRHQKATYSRTAATYSRTAPSLPALVVLPALLLAISPTSPPPPTPLP